LSIFGLALATISCIEDKFEEPEIPISSEVLDAKAWFESNESSFWDAGSENARITAKEIRKKVNWDRSKTYNQADGKKVIEVQLDYQDLIVPEHLIGASFSEETILHTLILFPKPNGNYVPYILKIYPDDAEKKFKLADFLAGGYQNIPADFSGTYLFHKWNEKLIGGWRIKDGEKVTRIKPSRKDNQKNNKENSRIAGDVVCYTITTTEYQVTCQRGFGCSDPEVIGVYYTTECEYTSTPPPPILVGEGWGGGGGTTPPEDDPCEVPDENIIGLRVDCEEDIEDIFAEIERLFQKINPCEREIIRSNLDLLPSIYQVYKNSVHANETTTMLYSISEVKEGHNNCADAFRHAYWNALNAISVPGKLAKGLADAHECASTNETEKTMDLHNNSVGRNIGYGHAFLNINNLNDLRVLQNNIIMNLSYGNLRVIYPLDSNYETVPSSSIVGSELHCN
jgi:hypothetical protein